VAEPHGDRLELRGLRALGTHGVLPEEHERAQPFEVDLDLYVDCSAAGQSDQLSDTVDYGALALALAAVIEGPHVQLLERLGELLAAQALAHAPRAQAVALTVRKLRPPVSLALDSAGVRLVRYR
jgi:dihydroneopterin aldolase/2-amino-4-hydroxy-6-hydroxymethyldihydropteridine diphosphokinase